MKEGEKKMDRRNEKGNTIKAIENVRERSLNKSGKSIWVDMRRNNEEGTW